VSLAHVKPGRVNGDPIGSEKPRGKDSSRRKARNDPGFTPTEQRQKNELMRQFMKNPEGGGIGNSEAFRANYDATFGPREDFLVPRYCARCRYEARTLTEMLWHQTQGGCGGSWNFDMRREGELRKATPKPIEERIREMVHELHPRLLP